MTDRDTMRWVWRGTALAALLIGWVFIAWQNHFHITAPLVVVCLAYLAVVATVYNLWRTGAAAVNSGDDEGDSTWGRPTGRIGELEREKRTLLKAIKEAEFDLQMGKLSKRDADDMIRAYRARAIDVIKEIDHLGLGAAGTPREQIMREVRARIEVDAKAHKKPEPKRAGDNGAKGKAPKASKDASKSSGANAAADKQSTKASAARSEEAAAASPASDKAEPVAAAAENDAATEAEADAAKEAAPTGAASLDDEAMDADSTTTVDSTRNHRAKEATP
jgi:membrane protein involved in colicin uptake